jgi:signal transduction histidine kinase
MHFRTGMPAAAPAKPQAADVNHGAGMRLSTFIIEHLDEIVAEWDRFAAHTVPAAEGTADASLHDHSRDILRAIAQDVEGAGSREPARIGAAETAAATHGALRHSAGFDLAQLTAEFRALRNCVLRLWGAKRFTNEADAFQQVMSFNDAIDQALAEAVARYAAEVDRARNMFLTVLGHDLRTPLGAISITSQYLAMRTVPDVKRQEAAARIDRCTTTLNALIKDVLEYTRSRLGKGVKVMRRPNDMAEICRTACEDIRLVHVDASFQCDIAGSLEGDYDSMRMHQAIWNLLNSSVQQSDRRLPVILRADADGDCVRVQIDARGRSLSVERLQSMFDPMAQFANSPALSEDVKPSIELGLFVAREIIRAHQGDVTVSCGADGMMRFEVVLPRKAA